ncbi:MAG: hypothetical protein E6Q97_38700 [Desulfurellales bacterium]|nr:MAG: hypothetical protein E6Q97_38700 [Desulfurellales bacterium]
MTPEERIAELERENEELRKRKVWIVAWQFKDVRPECAIFDDVDFARYRELLLRAQGIKPTLIESFVKI